MKRVLISCVLCLTSVVSLNSAIADDVWYAAPQYGYGLGPGWGTGVGGALGWGGGYGLGYGLGYGGFQQDTPWSSETKAMGHLVRAQGQYEESQAKAAVDLELARRRYIENQQKVMATRQEMRRSAMSLTAQQQEANRTARMRQEEFAAAHQPQPLSSKQVNPQTGRIAWPEILQAPVFTESRAVVDDLFEKRVRYGSTDEMNAQIKAQIGTLKETLRQQITAIPLAQYTDARKFLDRLVASVN